MTPVVPASIARTLTGPAGLGVADDLEDAYVDPGAVVGDPHLVVLGADPGGEVAVPGAGRERLELGLEVGGDRHLLLLGRGGQVEVVEREQPGQLGDRLGVVVDAQVDGDVVEPAVPGLVLDHEQRRGLPAAGVAAGRVAGGERLEQPVGERVPRGRSRARRPPSPRPPRSR